MAGGPVYVSKTDREYQLSDDKDKDFVEFDDGDNNTPEIEAIKQSSQKDRSLSIHSNNLSTQASVTKFNQSEAEKKPEESKKLSMPDMPQINSIDLNQFTQSTGAQKKEPEEQKRQEIPLKQLSLNNKEDLNNNDDENNGKKEIRQIKVTSQPTSMLNKKASVPSIKLTGLTAKVPSDTSKPESTTSARRVALRTTKSSYLMKQEQTTDSAREKESVSNKFSIYGRSGGDASANEAADKKPTISKRSSLFGGFKKP